VRDEERKGEKEMFASKKTSGTMEISLGSVSDEEYSGKFL
jgi:hypothetical protein